jgi:hypothetical protein
LAGGRTTIAQQPLATDSSVAASSLQPPASVPTIRDWNPKALDAWLGVVQDATADPKARRKAALKITEFLLPKIGKKAKIIPDEYGFLINPILVSAYRDTELELGRLMNYASCKIPAIAAEIKKLQARSDAIRPRLQVPCPTRYGNKEAAKDCERLMEFASLRDDGIALSEVQQAEEAHLKARLVVIHASPEAIARRRRAALEDADRRFRKYRLDGEFYAPPLSRKERNEHKFLRRLYPAEPKRDLSRLDSDFEWYRDHAFVDELLAPDGNFYPRDSKLRPGDPQGWVRMRELEERRAVGFQLTAAEEGELRDLRERYPEFAVVIDLMDLKYLYHHRRELEIARKAGLNFDAMNAQADDCCLGLRDPSKFIHEWQARRSVREDGGKAVGAATREP